MDDTTPSSPSKRARVAFSDEVEINYVEEWEKAPELIREEVRRAINRHIRNDDEEYDRIRNMFSQEDNSEEVPSPTTMRNYVAALLPHASSLSRSCSGLVRAILASDWAHRGDDYVSLFTRLILNIVSSQGTWLSAAVGMLVEMFTNPGRKVNVYRPASQSKVQLRVHFALKSILQHVPTASQVLAGTLGSHFPYPSDSKRTHIQYVRSALRIVDYAPELRSDILELVTERMVKIDVEIQVDLEELAVEIGDGLVQNLTEDRGEEDEELDSQDSDEDSDLEEDLDAELLRAKEINASVQKLDLVMDVLFDYYSQIFADPSLNATAAATLLSHFSTLILPTYQSRHIQFLQFHFFQTSEVLVDRFVGTCLHLTFDTTRPTIVRQSSAAYLASFVARGRHVPAQITRSVFAYIGNRLTELRAQYEPTCRGPDPERYSTFYALTQALLYIFCFRWKDLLATNEDNRESLSPPGLASATDLDDLDTFTFVPGVKDILNSVIFNRLNPLRICAPGIVEVFAELTEKVGIIYIYTLLEANKRVRLVYSMAKYANSDMKSRETALTAKRDGEGYRLDAYFPFDPYQLPRSKRWLADDYREWEKLGDDDSDADSRDDSDDE